MKHLYFTTLLLCLFLSAATARAAGFPVPEEDTQCIEQSEETHTGTLNITLGTTDKKRMELARKYTALQQAKGQDPSVITALYRASMKTGVDFELLILKASLESDLGRLNVSSKSSARGVFQYIESTWLTLIGRYGDEIGYPHYAAAAKKNNQFLKAEILALRHDPEISALIKAYQIKEESGVIESYKRGPATATDHYIAHMLGLGLAKQFYAMKRVSGSMPVAKAYRPEMREAAKLNPQFFYDGRRPLNARQSYKKFENLVNNEFARINRVANSKAPAKIAANEKPACTNVTPVSRIATTE